MRSALISIRIYDPAFGRIPKTGGDAAKAKAVKAVVSGPVTPECPGSILQMHPDFILVADEEALICQHTRRV